ncbi:hypothetical protein D3C81_1663940 [compost metagenome]
MCDAEIHATTAAEHFTADRAVNRIRIILGVLFGKFDADLHRPAGVHRVKTAEQRTAHRHPADEVVENTTEFFLTAHRIQAFAVGPAVG